jgi:hypothetical protein
VLGEADRFLGSEGGVVEAAEERDQPPAAALLADGVEQRAGLDRVGDPPPVDPVGGLGWCPLQRRHRVLVEQLQLDGVLQGGVEDLAPPAGHARRGPGAVKGLEEKDVGTPGLTELINDAMRRRTADPEAGMLFQLGAAILAQLYRYDDAIIFCMAIFQMFPVPKPCGLDGD